MAVNPGAAYQPYADERYIGVEASFELIDVDAATDAQATADPELWFSNLQQTHDKIVSMSNRIATIEPDEWRLNGGYVCVKMEDNGEVGYWSQAVSDASGNVDVTLTFTFSIPQSSRAFTVVFDDSTGNYCTDFSLTAFAADGTQMATQAITGNDQPIIIVDMATDGYSSLVLKCTKTNKPSRCVRICEVVFGYLRIFDDDDIASMSVKYQSTLDAQSMPSNMLTLTLDNTDRRYNIINPTGIYKYLQKGQGLNVSIFINGERVQMGRFYFETAKSDDNSMTVQITAYDRFYSLDSSECNIGQSGTWTVSDAVAAVLADAGLSVLTEIPTDVQARVIGRAIPQGTSHREALRMIAQAAKCVCFFNRQDAIQFVHPGQSLSEQSIDELTTDTMSDYPGITDTGLINAVEITVRDEYAENSDDVIYTAEHIATDEDRHALSIQNPLVPGQDVADWLLQISQYRIQYDVNERGNPARELHDTVTIDDIYGVNKTAQVIEQTFSVGTGLDGQVVALTNQVQ